MTSKPISTTPQGLSEPLIECLKTLDDRKGINLSLIDVRGMSSITDFLILCTANSEPHLRALVNAARMNLKSSKVAMAGVEFTPASGWAVLDAFDFMVHVFTADQREYYGLENLWRDARHLSVAPLLPPAPAGTPSQPPPQGFKSSWQPLEGLPNDDAFLSEVEPLEDPDAPHYGEPLDSEDSEWAASHEGRDEEDEDEDEEDFYAEEDEEGFDDESDDDEGDEDAPEEFSR